MLNEGPEATENRAETNLKAKVKVLHLFVCLFYPVMNVELLQLQRVKKTLSLSALDVTKFAEYQSKTCFRMAHFSERHTLPI